MAHIDDPRTATHREASKRHRCHFCLEYTLQDCLSLSGVGGEGRRKAQGFSTWLYAGCFPNISGFHTVLKFNVPSTHCYSLASGDWGNLTAVKDKMGTPVAALISAAVLLGPYLSSPYDRGNRDAVFLNVVLPRPHGHECGFLFCSVLLLPVSMQAGVAVHITSKTFSAARF